MDMLQCNLSCQQLIFIRKRLIENSKSDFVLVDICWKHTSNFEVYLFISSLRLPLIWISISSTQLSEALSCEDLSYFQLWINLILQNSKSSYSRSISSGISIPRISRFIPDLSALFINDSILLGKCLLTIIRSFILCAFIYDFNDLIKSIVISWWNHIF